MIYQAAAATHREPARRSTDDPALAPTVFVVEDDPDLCDSIRWLIESIGIAALCYPSAEAFLSAYDPRQPGCLVADIRLPGMSGIALQERLKERGAELPLIAITAYAEVSTAVKMMNAGAIEFLEKPFSDEELLTSIRRAIEVDRQARVKAAERAHVQARLDSLTPRERDILTCVAQGQPSKVIASTLGISDKTVEVHRARLMRKLEVESTAELIRLGLLLRR